MKMNLKLMITNICKMNANNFSIKTNTYKIIPDLSIYQNISNICKMNVNIRLTNVCKLFTTIPLILLTNICKTNANIFSNLVDARTKLANICQLFEIKLVNVC